MRSTHAHGSVRRGMLAVSLLASLLTLVAGEPSAQAHSLIPELAQAVVPPVGFGQSVFGELPPGDLATSLTWGPDGKLYVTSVQGVAVGNGFQSLSNGAIFSFADLGGVGGPPTEVASGFGQILGDVFGPDGTLYVADNDTATYRGSIVALRDPNKDGVYEQRRTVLKDIPNGRHQTNGMVFGPDGMLYVATGSATDDGIECGPEPVSSLQCPTQEVKPWTGSILRVNTSWTDVDLLKDVVMDANGYDDPGVIDDEEVLAATGFRNIFDVDTRPGEPCWLYTPMNGADNPAENEPLYRTNICDEHVVGTDANGQPIKGPVIDDAGFPSCMYGQHENPWPMPTGGHSHPENYTPDDNINQAVIDRFGHCPKDSVLKPIKFLSAHSGTSGLAFETGDNFPDRYDGDLFVAEWGSLWNTNGVPPELTGHKVAQVHLNPDGTVAWQRPFLTGLLPMDLDFGPDGAMYVADMNGSIYRVVFVQDTPDQTTIELSHGQFIPQVVVIPRDSEVVWVNLDDVVHDVTAEKAVIAVDPSEGSPVPPDGGAEINCPPIAPRASCRHEFEDEPGLWVYHSGASATDSASMQGAVIVAPVDR